MWADLSLATVSFGIGLLLAAILVVAEAVDKVSRSVRRRQGGTASRFVHQ